MFAQSVPIITSWATHSVTGKPLSEGMLEEALREQKLLSALELQNQLLYSGSDQVHGLS